MVEGGKGAGWWASGDFPVREGCRVHPLVDGRAAMLAMCRAFLAARDYILLAGWDLRADLELVRGEDARLGASLLAMSSADQKFLTNLVAEGLDEEAIAFWRAGNLRVADVLGFVARRGVRVGVLLWDAYHLGSHLTNDPEAERKKLAAVGVDCLLDDSSRAITHITQSLHQKCAVVDDRVAFLGGIDLTAQMEGDYDRWDTHIHPCESPERRSAYSPAAHPWHDVHTRVLGPAVADVRRNIVQRWSAVAARHTGPAWPSELPDADPAPVSDGISAQVWRTIPPHTYPFAPEGVGTIKDGYLHAIHSARRFIYLENQYLWPEVFVGLDSLRWGERSPDAMDVLEALRDALERGVRVAIVLPDHPNCGRKFTDGGVAWLSAQAPRALADGQLSIFTLGASQVVDGRMVYRPVYVHAKVMIVDDQFWTAGSANLNSRGMRSDAEINIASLDPTVARGMRLGLWTEHLHAGERQGLHLYDPLAGLDRLRASAEANLERVRAGEPLDGHLLPYLPASVGKALGVSVHPEHGWLDALPGGAGALAPKYAHRYL